jgi:hypothetical protein
VQVVHVRYFEGLTRVQDSKIARLQDKKNPEPVTLRTALNQPNPFQAMTRNQVPGYSGHSQLFTKEPE